MLLFPARILKLVVLLVFVVLSIFISYRFVSISRRIYELF